MQIVISITKFAADAEFKVVSDDDGIPENWMGLDIGPESTKSFCEAVKRAKTIVWNGPMGVFEMEPFSAGTMGIANAVARSNGKSVVGGGDSALALRTAGVTPFITHLSSGGGASLEFLEGRELPGIEALRDVRKRSDV